MFHTPKVVMIKPITKSKFRPAVKKYKCSVGCLNNRLVD